MQVPSFFVFFEPNPPEPVVSFAQIVAERLGVERWYTPGARDERKVVRLLCGEGQLGRKDGFDRACGGYGCLAVQCVPWIVLAEEVDGDAVRIGIAIVNFGPQASAVFRIGPAPSFQVIIPISA